jgi:transaldolase
MYVDDLIAPHTVNTMPEATLHATADHGTIEPDTITTHYDEARAVIADLEALGVSYADVVRVLEEEGVRKFADSWDDVKTTVGGQLDAMRAQAAAARR